MRSKRGLEVGRVVDGVRPGVGGQELVVIAEALAEIGGQATAAYDPRQFQFALKLNW